MIRELHLQGVGPAPELSVSFDDRLNLFIITPATKNRNRCR